MRGLAILFSGLTLFYLTNMMFDAEQASNGSANNQTKSSLAIPVLLDEQMLEVETKWQRPVKEDEVKPKESTKSVEDDSYQLKFGEKQFKLLGVFTNQGRDFVLVKGTDEKTRKLFKGDSLMENVILANIKNNTVTFLADKEEVKIKLFERNQNEKN